MDDPGTDMDPTDDGRTAPNTPNGITDGSDSSVGEDDAAVRDPDGLLISGVVPPEMVSE